MVFSISPSFILQVLQDRQELRIERVTQLMILASSVWRRLWGETSHSPPPETKGYSVQSRATDVENACPKLLTKNVYTHVNRQKSDDNHFNERSQLTDP